MRLNVLVVLLLSRASVAESLNLITPAVVNGTDAAIEAFPFMVSESREIEMKLFLEVHSTVSFHPCRKCATYRSPSG